MKLCRDCKYCAVPSAKHGLAGAECLHWHAMHTDPVTGATRPYLCATLRASCVDGDCGPDARHFEAALRAAG